LISIKGLRSPAFFLVFYFVANSLSNVRFAKTLVLGIIASSLINVAYSASQITVGRGLQVDQISQDSPFATSEIRLGDIILEADGRPVEKLEDLSSAVLSNRGPVRLKLQRYESIEEVLVSRRALRNSSSSGTLGLSVSKGRNFRVSGFYSHYETYAEVLQLIASLTVGLLIGQRRKWSARGLFLTVALALLVGTLIMTSTRATLAGLAVSVGIIAVLSYRPGIVAVVLLSFLVLAPAALYSITRVRGPILFDLQEGSTAYRAELWRESFRLIRDHPLVGIGKGSEGRPELKQRYGLFDGGKLPPGHFHSTPIQIATWWGLPALMFYCSMMAVLMTHFIALSVRLKRERLSDEWGIALGGIGALAAFNVSSIFHFNFGDGEVVMMFWLIAGLVCALGRLTTAADTGFAAIGRPRTSSEDSSDRNQRPEQEGASESRAQAAKARQRL
jgi:O-antigen ligase